MTLNGAVLGLVGFVLSNLGAVAGGVYLGHRFAAQIDALYEKAEAAFAHLYALVSGRR